MLQRRASLIDPLAVESGALGRAVKGNDAPIVGRLARMPRGKGDRLGRCPHGHQRPINLERTRATEPDRDARLNRENCPLADQHITDNKIGRLSARPSRIPPDEVAYSGVGVRLMCDLDAAWHRHFRRDQAPFHVAAWWKHEQINR